VRVTTRLDAPGEGAEGGKQKGSLAEKDAGDDDDEAGGADCTLKARAGVDEGDHVDREVRQHGVEPGEGECAIELGDAAMVESAKDTRRVEAEGGNGFLRRVYKGSRTVSMSGGMSGRLDRTLDPSSGSEGKDVPVMPMKTLRVKMIFVATGRDTYAVI
jgi:hypothetical protein